MSLSTWFANLEVEAKTEIDKLGAEAEVIAEKVGKVIIPEVEAFLKELGSLAIQAVIAEAPKLISGSEKFGSAVTSIVQTVESQGKAIAIQDAQMAVQGAFRAVQVAVSVPTS